MPDLKVRNSKFIPSCRYKSEKTPDTQVKMVRFYMRMAELNTNNLPTETCYPWTPLFCHAAMNPCSSMRVLFVSTFQNNLNLAEKTRKIFQYTTSFFGREA